MLLHKRSCRRIYSCKVYDGVSRRAHQDNIFNVTCITRIAQKNMKGYYSLLHIFLLRFAPCSSPWHSQKNTERKCKLLSNMLFVILLPTTLVTTSPRARHVDIISRRVAPARTSFPASAAATSSPSDSVAFQLQSRNSCTFKTLLCYESTLHFLYGGGSMFIW